MQYQTGRYYLSWHKCPHSLALWRALLWHITLTRSILLCQVKYKVRTLWTSPLHVVLKDVLTYIHRFQIDWYILKTCQTFPFQYIDFLSWCILHLSIPLRQVLSWYITLFHSPLENTVLTYLTSFHSHLAGSVMTYYLIQFPTGRYSPDIYNLIKFPLVQGLSWEILLLNSLLEHTVLTYLTYFQTCHDILLNSIPL